MLMFYTALLETPEQKEKFTYIYETYSSLMIHAAQTAMREKFLAEDVVHEVFLNMISNIDIVRMDDRVKLKSYLMHITKNKAIDMIRKNKREITVDDSIENILL